jgi:hypothetical protein
VRFGGQTKGKHPAMNRLLLGSILVGIHSYATLDMPDASGTPLSGKEKTASIEYLTPTDESRDIRTTNIDLGYLLTRVEKVNLSICACLTATYATGNITQLDGSLESGTLKTVRYDNSAFGLGPGLLASFTLWRISMFSIHLNGRGNFLVYNKKFPAGGEHYNFMWRGGPSLEYEIGKSKVIGVGYHWAHVSNGQGVGAQNPSYDAAGVIVTFNGFF